MAARRARHVVVSIFVNPLQFAAGEDLERYPRTLQADLDALAATDCDLVFAPPEAALYPHGREGLTEVHVPELSTRHCGAHRPGHFEGVATIVDRLFDVVRPTRAYFGAKDYQQCLVVEDLSRARGGAPEIVRCPIVRSSAGLALSSRNALLSDEAREDALVLSRALREVKAAWDQGLRDAEALAGMLTAGLEHPRIELEYAEIRDPSGWTADAPSGLVDQAVALVAAQVGGVRLLDNMELSAP